MSLAVTTTTVGLVADGAVRSRREKLGISRAALAARAGCSVTYLQNIEAGAVPRLSEVMPRLEAELTHLERLGADSASR